MVDNNKIYHFSINLILGIIAFFCIMPFILLIVASFTDEHVLIRDGYSFFPGALSLSSYKYIFSGSAKILRGYGLTVLVTVVGTALNVILTTLLAYPLAQRFLPGRKVLSFYVFFTMLFNGGLVPQYMLWSNFFHIKDTIFALLVPNLLMGAFYIIMMRSYFMANIPEALGEAARIDGAGEFRILLKIVMPISKPMVATLGLMAGLAYWNDWLNGLYYINDEKMFTMQNILNRMLKDAQFLATGAASNVGDLIRDTPLNGMKMAVAVVGVVPILIIYPFIQKYLVQGITIGAVKG